MDETWLNTTGRQTDGLSLRGPLSLETLTPPYVPRLNSTPSA